MNVKIRPQWVISLVILVVMFVGARIYVGRAIDHETQPQKQVRSPHPQERPARADLVPPAPPPAPDETGLVVRPIAHITAVVEAANDEEREEFYESARRDAAAVTEAIATQVPLERRRRILEQYDDLLTTQDVAPVKAEITKLRADLERWFGELPPAATEPDADEP